MKWLMDNMCVKRGVMGMVEGGELVHFARLIYLGQQQKMEAEL